MNTNNPFKARPAAWITSLLCACVLVLPACEDEEDAPEEKVTVEASATLNAEQETDDVTSPGTGTFTGTYNKNTGEFTFTLNWTNLTGPPTMMHFHGPAGPGTNASVKIGITGFPADAAGSVSGTVTVEEGDRADLLAGKWYVNIHTEAYPPGEIRGQVTFPAGSGGDNGGGGGGGDGDGY
ncbi:CHRD domain-containing protein [Anseongella ginsenosidimutans]|uniref:CHRD domain-containing protein n=1 Tax=Anseongella ginsenosidimutans TaxID=496056 RepID=A0A4R3KNQ0_9SPHI|nr:CHRD domain-containing protein [Anseongella ginsenosidimutans]QEC52045.1 CHRD domain-containing protein [Anseongella ginsenosidimutans]TCS85647.1 CHRD domain-containing protein [Anseongella ginsenosidimutans]